MTDSTLQLLKSEKFGEVKADIYNSAELDEMFMTTEQLGNCLGYASGRKGIDNILDRNQYLKNEEFSVTLKMRATDGKAYNTRLFNEDGIYEVTFLSKTDKAIEFRRWVRGILTSLRKGELQLSSDGVSLTPQVLSQKLEQLLNHNEQLAQQNKDILELVDSLYDEVEGLSAMVDFAKCDLKDEIESSFSYLAEKIDELKSQNLIDDLTNETKDSLPSTEIDDNKIIDNYRALLNAITTEDIETPIDIMRKSIKPLIEKRNDGSTGGTCTYRKVYSAMGVGWMHRQTRYKNEHGLKNHPKKITLIEQDKKLLKLFVDTVNELLKD